MTTEQYHNLKSEIEYSNKLLVEHIRVSKLMARMTASICHHTGNDKLSNIIGAMEKEI